GEEGTGHPLTPVLHFCNSHIRETTITTTTQVVETPVIISGPAGTVLVEEKPVRTIPGPAGIVQADKLLKQKDIVLGWDEAVMSTQEYMKKVVEDVGEDKDFKSGAWVSANEYVNANGGISCTLNALGDLTVNVKDLTVFSPKPSIHYLNIIIKNVIKVFHNDSVPGNGSGVGGSGMLMEEEEIVKLMDEEEMAYLELQVCWNVTHQKMVDKQALSLALEEKAKQARADQEWLEKCKKDA
nr:hypothetical protein [Tanacetum cinerariifolium]